MRGVNDMIDYTQKNYDWDSLRQMQAIEGSFERLPRPEMFSPASCANCQRCILFRDGSICCREYEVDWEDNITAHMNSCEHWME